MSTAAIVASIAAIVLILIIAGSALIMSSSISDRDHNQDQDHRDQP